MDQQPLQNVVTTPQMKPPHAAGIVQANRIGNRYFPLFTTRNGRSKSIGHNHQNSFLLTC